jgi:hypothetical protein
MKIKVKCGICSVELIQIEKPEVSQEDQDLYKNTTMCSVDGSADIQIEIITE